METQKRLFVKCSCSGEALEFVWDKENNMMDIAMWKQGFNTYRLSWHEKLRWIWHIIIKGDIWTDCIILDKKDVVKVKKYFNSL